MRRPARVALMPAFMAGLLGSFFGADSLTTSWAIPFSLPNALSPNHSAPASSVPRSFRMVAQAATLPEEPAEYDRREVEAYYDWRNDLFFRRFDMSGMGTADFMTARRTYRVWLSEFGTPVVVTMSNPLFYWVDFNRNGEFEPNQGEMWSDPEEDGINGNERPYDVHHPQGREPAVGPQAGAPPGKGHRPLPDPNRWR